MAIPVILKSSEREIDANACHNRQLVYALKCDSVEIEYVVSVVYVGWAKVDFKERS